MSAPALSYSCGRCGWATTTAGISVTLTDLGALIDQHAAECPAAPHCPTCRCDSRSVMVERLVENWPPS